MSPDTKGKKAKGSSTSAKGSSSSAQGPDESGGPQNLDLSALYRTFEGLGAVGSGSEQTNDAAQDRGDQHEKVSAKRAEKKARKELHKLGLEAVPGVCRVVIRRIPMVTFTIAKPEVFKVKGIDSYIVFGEAVIEDAREKAQIAAAKHLMNMPTQYPLVIHEEKEDSDDDADLEDTAEPGELQAEGDSGVSDIDVRLIMQQAGVSRAKAIRTLKNNDNDIVNAIMELTM